MHAATEGRPVVDVLGDDPEVAVGDPATVDIVWTTYVCPIKACANPPAPASTAKPDKAASVTRFLAHVKTVMDAEVKAGGKVFLPTQLESSTPLARGPLGSDSD